MGIFDVNMPMLYGEGSKAFIRLQEQILNQVSDDSLFTWKSSPESAIDAPYRGLLALSPREFEHCADIAIFDVDQMDASKATTIAGQVCCRRVLRTLCSFQDFTRNSFVMGGLLFP